MVDDQIVCAMIAPNYRAEKQARKRTVHLSADFEESVESTESTVDAFEQSRECQWTTEKDFATKVRGKQHTLDLVGDTIQQHNSNAVLRSDTQPRRAIPYTIALSALFRPNVTVRPRKKNMSKKAATTKKAVAAATLAAAVATVVSSSTSSSSCSGTSATCATAATPSTAAATATAFQLDRRAPATTTPTPRGNIDSNRKRLFYGGATPSQVVSSAAVVTPEPDFSRSDDDDARAGTDDTAATRRRQKKKRRTKNPAAVALPAKKNLDRGEETGGVVADGPKKRTESFGALWSGSLHLHITNRLNAEACSSNDVAAVQEEAPCSASTSVEPHTLILGTHPSVKSLGKQQYYGHPMKYVYAYRALPCLVQVIFPANQMLTPSRRFTICSAFWWIAGDCLGFRRGEAVGASGRPYMFASQLRHGAEKIIEYEQQITELVSRGFAVWDVVKSCERKGSLDQNIKKEIPNDIPGFVAAHPSICRIVLANGGTGSTMFVKHFKTWIKRGCEEVTDTSKIQFVVADNDQSRKAFGKHVSDGGDDAQQPQDGRRKITLVTAIGVSPAAATASYEEKRDFWDAYVYQPGLQDFESIMANKRRN